LTSRSRVEVGSEPSLVRLEGSGAPGIGPEGRAVHAKWQAASWSSAGPVNWGSTSEQIGCAMGHRGWNRQPGGISNNPGGSPCKAASPDRFRIPIFGAAAINAIV
jgi:hypothetical protein